MKTIVCKCGHSFDWDAVESRGVQPVPADFADCDCDPKPPHRKKLVESAHSATCAGRSYKLDLKNCPKCSTTLAERT